MKEHNQTNRMFTFGIAIAFGAAAMMLPKEFASGQTTENTTENVETLSAVETTSLVLDLAAKLKLIEEELNRRILPVGTYLLMDRRCPGSHLQDVTDQFTGRLLRVDASVESVPTFVDGDGSHVHSGGSHTHDVTGRTSNLGGGQRKGTLTRDTTVPHEGTRLTVSGSALPADHQHAGGSHEHASAGFRICRVIY